MLKGFITNLGKYNEGELIGEWVVFPIDENEEKELLKRIGCDNPQYEEYFFTDWEDYEVGEYLSIEEANELAERMDNIDEDKLNAIIEAETSDFREALEMAEDDDVYLHKGQSLEDVAYDIVHDCYNLPDIAERYFDYEAFARDLSFDGYTETSYGVLEVR